MEPKQRTPGGHEIPVPKRGDVLRDLLKAARAPRKADDEDTSADDGGGAEQEQ